MFWFKNFEVYIFIGTFGSLVICYSMYWALNKSKLTFKDFIDNLGHFVFLFFILAFLTPVLQSLTVNLSSETTGIFVVIFSICHLYAYDFTYKKGVLTKTEPVVKSPTSLNAIFVAAILLASRLTRFISVFLFLLHSLLLFGFGPFLRKMLRSYSRSCYELITVAGTLLLFWHIFALNHLMGVIYISTALSIALGGPILFIYAYRFKK